MGNKAKFRDMTLHDLDRIMELELENFTAPWFKEHYEYELKENPFARMRVLCIAEEIIGYFGLWVLFEEAQLTTIAVKEAYKGQGYGTMLLRECIRLANEMGCERISLEVRVSNTRAQKLYESAGFEVISTRPQYYEDNQEDAYLMMKGI